MSAGHTVAIVQARMGSTRLPGKSMAPISGRPMLWHVLRRAAASRRVDEVVLATTTNPADDCLDEVARSVGTVSYRGSEHDVLDRYWEAVRRSRADIVVRLTADNPLNDPGIVDETIALFARSGVDYAGNIHPRTFPKGLDVEVLTAEALEIAFRLATDPYDREHVTPFIYRTAPERFTRANLTWTADLSAWRWTVDDAADLEFAREVYRRLWREDGRPFSFEEVLGLVDGDPSLRALCERSVEAESARG